MGVQINQELIGFESESNKEYMLKEESSLNEATGEMIHKNQDQSSMCDKAFNSSSSSFRTNGRNLVGEKPFSCSICVKTFVQSSSLKRHEKIHYSEKAFGCFKCDKSFHRADHLLTHETTHPSDSKNLIVKKRKEDIPVLKV